MSPSFYSNFSSEMNFSDIDHAVIGSGIGGLTVATWLAKAGKKVVVFERHNVPGGFMHTFKRANGFQWDVGVHYVGNMMEKGSLRGLFDFLTGKDFVWESMGDIYDQIQIGDDIYNLPSGKENYRKQLISYFPNEEKNINKYLQLVEKANRIAGFYFMEKIFGRLLSKTLGSLIRKIYSTYTNRTTLEVLSEFIENKRLIAVLCAQFGNYGKTPKYSSFAFHALVVSHFFEGGYYPAGGADQIPANILKRLASFGAKVVVKAIVSEIVVENNTVKGLIVNGLFVKCSSVISDAGVNNTFNHLLKEKDRLRCNFNLLNVKPSIGHMCLYLGLNGSDAELKLPKHNIWYYKGDTFDEIFDNIKLKTLPSEFAYISFPSAKDPLWKDKHPGLATIQVVTVGKYEWFSDYSDQTCMHREDAYLELKKEFEQSMLLTLYKLLPQIKGRVAFVEVSTPLSTKHFSNYEHGEIYGLEHTPNRYKLLFLRPETRIKGLRLVGQDITMVGLASAMLSGMFCAITILKFKVWRIFKEIRSV